MKNYIEILKFEFYHKASASNQKIMHLSEQDLFSSLSNFISETLF